MPALVRHRRPGRCASSRPLFPAAASPSLPVLFARLPIRSLSLFASLAPFCGSRSVLLLLAPSVPFCGCPSAPPFPVPFAPFCGSPPVPRFPLPFVPFCGSPLPSAGRRGAAATSADEPPCRSRGRGASVQARASTRLRPVAVALPQPAPSSQGGAPAGLTHAQKAPSLSL